LKDAEANKQILGFNTKLEILQKAQHFYDIPVDQGTVEEIRTMIRETKLARDEEKIDENQLAINNQVLCELEN
jgi:hypothetical protein